MSSLRFSAVLLISAMACDGSRLAVPLPDPFANVPSSITVHGQALVLDASLWRDFMPISPSDGKSLIASLRVHASDGSALANSLHADSVWVVFGGDVWAASVGEEQLIGSPPVALQVVARNGPKWGPGVSVDVVLRVRDSSGKTFLLRSPGQTIQRTD